MNHKIYAAEVDRPMGTTAVLVVTKRLDNGMIVHSVFVDSVFQGEAATPEAINALIATSLPAAVNAKAAAMLPPPYARKAVPTPAELVSGWGNGSTVDD